MDQHRPGRKTELATADQALEDLLGTLLAEVPEHVAPSPVKEPPQAPPVVQSAPPLPASQEIAVNESVPAVQEKAIKPDQQASFNKSPEVPIQAEQEVSAQPSMATRPQWAESDFKVLLVRIGEMRFAVPLMLLNSIVKLEPDTDVVGVPAQPAWHRGVMRYREQKLVLADIGRLLNLQVGEIGGAYVLVIGDGRVGLSCDALEEQITLQAESVKWRQAGDKRDWIHGVLSDHMCVLLNLDEVASRMK